MQTMRTRCAFSGNENLKTSTKPIMRMPPMLDTISYFMFKNSIPIRSLRTNLTCINIC